MQKAKRGRPRMNKTYRQNVVRFSYMEDTIKNIMDLVDSEERDKINALLSNLVDHEKQKVAMKS
ncbi:hypothetical protein BCJMU51_p61 (plasmid) [Bacillus cereus]|uniref:hypothetical protein n=1 Tax=Bacillus TaxID=1386 RepID=UPI0009759423|nr:MULTISPECIES: hypothetical protein [Bacillus]ONG89100.1 hypothetical protein BKK40_18620 [Bacillus cereus]BCC09608.1 hypothetical protein BCM0060_p57 [Bacillus cereus]BCC56688.1 hypothetical protein BCJMU07_p92 [Bacillus cereus]BCC74295.1 hypothetical protein BCJMU51_p61 [Bacillus cereus]BCD33070.1 hypothetical protein BC30102_p94 [Bacillus cereus]